MAEDQFHMQIRAGLRLRTQIKRVSEKFGLNYTDIVRSSLELGVRVMEKLLEGQEIMAKEYMRLLKTNSRIGRATMIDYDEETINPDKNESNGHRRKK
jgi:hypothetical protein